VLISEPASVFSNTGDYGLKVMHEIKVKKSSNGYGNGFKSINNIPYMIA
jgi:hypothetical protein